jgi:S-ribosylhomocysteine lyase
VDYLEANVDSAKTFEYPQTERLVTEDGRSFFDS